MAEISHFFYLQFLLMVSQNYKKSQLDDFLNTMKH